MGIEPAQRFTDHRENLRRPLNHQREMILDTTINRVNDNFEKAVVFWEVISAVYKIRRKKILLPRKFIRFIDEDFGYKFDHITETFVKL